MRLSLLLALLLSLSATLPAQDTAEPDASPGMIPLEPTDEIVAAPDFEWLRRPGFESVICPFIGEVDYEPGDIECGLIRVPENREVADSRTIEVMFVKIHATGEDSEGEPVEVRDDPVLYLTGGPGVVVQTYVERLKDHTLVQQRDLYILEQRGIANSGAFCPFWGSRDRASRIHGDYEQSQRAGLEDARACIERARGAGIDVNGYHTFENARDVKALRLALGHETWNVWGISYGSVLGQAVLEVDPEGVAAMIIDAMVPLDLEGLMRMPHWYARLMDRFFEACAEQDDCASAYPELEARYRNAIQAMLDAPVEVEVPAGEVYPDGRAYLFQDIIAGLPFGTAYEQSTHGAIPAILDGLARQVEEGNTDFFRAVALATGGDMGVSVSMGMATSVRCLDGYYERNAEEAARTLADHPLYARAFGTGPVTAEAADLCRELGLAPRDASLYEINDTDVPLVIANGAWDPITPPPLARYVAERIPSARYVEFPHAGHGPTRSIECAGDFMNAFFDDPSAALDMDCVENGEEAAEYITSYLATDAAQRALILAETDEERLGIHLVWAVVSLGLVLKGVLLIGGGVLARRINGQKVERAGRARLWTGLAALAGVLYAAGLGIGGAMTVEIAPAMVLFGLAGPAPWMAWFGPAALLLGLGALVQILRHRADLPRASLIGLVPVALGAISLSVFGAFWDLWPLF